MRRGRGEVTAGKQETLERTWMCARAISLVATPAGAICGTRLQPAMSARICCVWRTSDGPFSSRLWRRALAFVPTWAATSKRASVEANETPACHSSFNVVVDRHKVPRMVAGGSNFPASHVSHAITQCQTCRRLSPTTAAPLGCSSDQASRSCADTCQIVPQ